MCKLWPNVSDTQLSFVALDVKLALSLAGEALSAITPPFALCKSLSIVCIAYHLSVYKFAK